MILQRNSKLVILGNLGMAGHTPKMIVSIWRNTWHLSAVKKSTVSFTFFLSYFFIAKILQTCFGYFGHAWLCTAKVILSIYWKLLCLSAGAKNLTSFPMLFWRLVDNILAHKSRTRILPNMGLVVKHQRQY